MRQSCACFIESLSETTFSFPPHTVKCCQMLSTFLHTSQPRHISMHEVTPNSNIKNIYKQSLPPHSQIPLSLPSLQHHFSNLSLFLLSKNTLCNSTPPQYSSSSLSHLVFQLYITKHVKFHFLSHTRSVLSYLCIVPLNKCRKKSLFS